MDKKISKRKKNLTITWILGGIFLIFLFVIFWYIFHNRETYKPGEQVEGLTSDLARDLPPDYPRVVFKDVTDSAGIHFRHFSGKRSSQLPEDMGSGAAWGDYDNDGWQDLFIANFAGPLTMTPVEIKNSEAYCQLYHNNHNGSFSEVSKQAHLDLRAFANGAAWADIDNDGLLDLAVSCFGKNKLYRNNKDGTFTDISELSGIGMPEGFWTGLTWGDYNKDGYPDLYICGYVQYTALESGKVSKQYNADVPANLNPTSFTPAGNKLFKNNKNNTFTDVTDELKVANPEGRSLSASWCDFDADGWPDLYVANDVSDNVFYRNTGKGSFKDISHAALVADYRGAMGLAMGDWNNDGDMDIFITHWIAQENALYDNMLMQLNNIGMQKNAELKFMDNADRFGLGQIALDFIGFGTFFFDYNNDGRLDLFVANGSTFEDRDHKEKLIPMEDHLFWNRNNDEGFYNVSPVSGSYFNRKYVGRGAAAADYDNDGDMDVFIVNNDGPAFLLRNDGGNKSNWIELDLKTKDNNRFALGTKIKISSSGVAQIRQVGTEGSYLSQNSIIQHFGLGGNSRIDTLEITWPDNKKEQRFDINTNQRLEITEK